jgi:hypothetical protein
MLVQYRRTQFCISKCPRRAQRVRGIRGRDSSKGGSFEDVMTVSREDSCRSRSLALSRSLSEIFPGS